MQILQNLFGMMLSVATVAYVPAVQADYTDYVTETTFGTNGTLAAALENVLETYNSTGNPTLIMQTEVQQIGNSVYNVGQNYGALGQEMTSSTPQMDFVTKHISGYCSPNIALEQQYFTCTGQTGNLANDAVSGQLLEMGDIRTSVLLEPLVYTPVIDIAAQNFIRNITMPFPSSMYANYISNPTTFGKNTSQRKAYASYMANQALIGVARYAMDEMYAMRVPGSTLGLSGNAANQSVMGVMSSEAMRRYEDPNYLIFLTNTSTDDVALLRELAAMKSFELWMSYQSYRQNERIAALLAAILANGVNPIISQNNSIISSGMTPPGQ